MVLNAAKFNYGDKHFSKYFNERNKDLHEITKIHEKVREKFFIKLKACTVCEQLWYPHSGAKRRKFENQFICHSCYSYVRNTDNLATISKLEHIPPLSPLNNVCMNEVPPEVDRCHNFELRLLAPRQIFIWMHAKPVSGEPYVRGNLVLVPADPQTTLKGVTSKLKIPHSNPEVIRVELRRRLSDKGHHISHTIRPKYVIEAARALAETPLYKELD